jgi:carboxylesterase type B
MWLIETDEMTKTLSSTLLECLKPTVMKVWIHGGAYVIGSKNEYSGIIFAQNGVINVIINYRLGTLGSHKLMKCLKPSYLY